jgi:CheY-like chemotaxis protein/AraC-like DNA-binding protein
VSTAKINTDLESTRPLQILIIDDNPRIHRDFDLVLCEESGNPELDEDDRLIYGRQAGPDLSKPVYALDHAYSSQEGIAMVQHGLVEGRFYLLAFVDIRMPGLDGVETIAKIWQIDPRIQMVICTAYADYSQEDLIRKLGQTDKLLVLKKPFDSIEVTQLAITLTAKWFLTRQAALKQEQLELLVSQRTRTILNLQRRESHDLYEANADDAANSAPGSYIGDNKLPLILLVENNAEMGRNLSGLLGEKFEIVEARAGDAGVEIAQEIIPDLIIVGFLPPADGVRLCRTLKNVPLTSHIPIILLANSESEDSQLRALEAGADDYIIKPMDAALLRSRVSKLLESQRKLRTYLHQGAPLQPRDLAVNRTDARMLQRIIEVIEQNMSDSDFDVDVLAQKMAVGRRQLFRKVRAMIDTTPKALIRFVRLKRSAQLLKESEMTITEITFAVGFQDVKHFRTLFKQQFGKVPSEFIRNQVPSA